MQTFAEIPCVRLRVGGDQQPGWFPDNAEKPLPTPVRELEFKLAITEDGGGNFLFLYESIDGTCYGDTWHETFEEAMDAARHYFGIAEEMWTRLHFTPEE